MNRSKLPAGKPTRRRRRIRYAARKALWAGGVAALVVAMVLADRLGFFGRAGQSDWEKYHGRQFKVVRIVDGDTLDVDVPDGRFGRTRVRLWGVDTPETVKRDTPVQYYGPQATAYTKSLAAGRTVTLRLYRHRTRGRYKRLLAYVILPGGKNLSEEIIVTGHGYADPRFDHPLSRRFSREQTRARKAGIGLWKGVTDADLPGYYRGRIKIRSGK